MKIEPNKQGKFILLDSENNSVSFDYAIDASEALALKDEKGNSKYKLPFFPTKGMVSKIPIIKENIEQKAINIDEEETPVTNVIEREVKTLKKRGRKKKNDIENKENLE